MLNIQSFNSNEIPDSIIEFVVICAKYNDRWILCKHQDRNTYEFPGGHIEKGESPEIAAKRELFEETGARQYKISQVCVYSLVGYDGVTNHHNISYGKLFFADIKSLGPLPHYEINELYFWKKLSMDSYKYTYPDVQRYLIEKIQYFLAKYN